MPYILHINASNQIYKAFTAAHRHNSWILAVNKNEPITADQVITDIKQTKREGNKTIQFVLVKRNELVQRENL